VAAVGEGEEGEGGDDESEEEALGRFSSKLESITPERRGFRRLPKSSLEHGRPSFDLYLELLADFSVE